VPQMNGGEFDPVVVFDGRTGRVTGTEWRSRDGS
jgi:hypothetical protein